MGRSIPEAKPPAEEEMESLSRMARESADFFEGLEKALKSIQHVPPDNPPPPKGVEHK